MRQTQVEAIASAVNQRVSSGLSELLHKDEGYKELCATVAKESQMLYERCNTLEKQQMLESYIENSLRVKSVESHFTYMLAISDFNYFKKAVSSRAWNSVMLNCTDMFISGNATSPLEPFVEDDTSGPNKQRSRSVRRIPLLIAALGMALCLLTGACLPITIYYITQGDTFTRVTSDPVELLDTLGEGSFRSLEEAAQSYGLERVAPTWVPKQYTLDSVGTNDEDGYTSLYAWYVSDSDSQQGISVRIVCYQQAESMVEKYEMEVEGGEEHFTDGIRYFVTQNKQSTRAVWLNGNCLCSISGPVSENDIEQMIKSTKW